MSGIRKYVVVILSILFALSFWFSAYLIRNEVGCVVLWNGKEAYFFLRETSFGYHVKWAGYPFEAGLEMLGGVPSPDDVNWSSTVLHVSASGVDRHVLPKARQGRYSEPGMFSYHDGRLWANCPDIGGLCTWVGDHFEPGPKEQQGGSDWLESLNPRHFDQGWFSDTFAADSVSGRSLTIRLENGTELLIAGHRRADGHGTLSVDMVTPAQKPTRLIDVEVYVARVSKSDYRRALGTF